MRKVFLLLFILLSGSIYSQDYNCYEREAYLNKENIAVNNVYEDVMIAKREATRMYDIAEGIADRINSWYTPSSYGYSGMVAEYNAAARKSRKASDYANSLIDPYNDRRDTFLEDVKEFNRNCVGKIKN